MIQSVTCRKCQSEACTVFPADVRIYINGSRTLSAPPVNPAPNILVCLDCGWSEFSVSPAWLAARWLRPIAVPTYLAASPTAVSGD